MYQPIVVYMALAYVRKRCLNRFDHCVAWLSTISIMLSMIAIVVILSVINGFQNELEKNVLKFIPHVLLTTYEKKINSNYINILKLKKLINVMHLSPYITSKAVLQSIHRITIGTICSIDPKDSIQLSIYSLEQYKDKLISGKYQIILGTKLANLLKVSIGDTLRLIVPTIRYFTPIGYIPSQRLCTIIGIFNSNSEADNYQILIHQDDATHLMHYSDGYVTGLRLWLKKPLKVEKYNSQSLPYQLIWHDWREEKGELFQAISMEKNMIGLLLSFIVIVSIFSVITSLGLLITEKQIEVAILQTQGLTYYQIMLIFIIQSTCISTIGIILGISIGVFCSYQLNYLISFFNISFNNIILPIAINPIQIIMISLSIIIITILSTIYPLWKIKKINLTKLLCT